MDPFAHSSFTWPYSSHDTLIQCDSTSAAIPDALFGEVCSNVLRPVAGHSFSVDTGPQSTEEPTQQLFSWGGSGNHPTPSYANAPTTISASTGSAWEGQYAVSGTGDLTFTGVSASDQCGIPPSIDTTADVLSSTYSLGYMDTTADVLSSTYGLGYVDSDHNSCFWDVPAVQASPSPGATLQYVPVHVVPTPPSPMASLPSPLRSGWNFSDAHIFNEVPEFMPIQHDLGGSAANNQIPLTDTLEPVRLGDVFCADASDLMMKMEDTNPTVSARSEVLILDECLALSAVKAAEISARLSSARHQALNLHHCNLLIDSTLREDDNSAEWEADRFDSCAGTGAVRALGEPVGNQHKTSFADFDDAGLSPDMYRAHCRAPFAGIKVGTSGGFTVTGEIERLSQALVDKSDQIPKGISVNSAAAGRMLSSAMEPDCNPAFSAPSKGFNHSQHACLEFHDYWDFCTNNTESDGHDAKPDSGASRTSSRMTMHLQHLGGGDGTAVCDRLDSYMEGADKEVSGTLKHVTLDALQSVYDLPINEAAKKLGLGVTVLKKFCRKFNIPRWPYRKLKSLEKLENSLKSLLDSSVKQSLMDDLSKDELSHTLEKVQDYRQLILKDPSIDLEAEVKKWRQRNFKMEFKQRHTGL